MSAGTAAQIGHFGDIWGYVPLGPSKIVGSGDDLCRGHAVAMWFRLTGAPSAASGNWYEATLYCTINRVETSKPWFKLSLEAVPGNAAKCRFVVQGMQSGSGEIRGTDFTNATYSIFGADGVSPVLDKWFFICASRCGTANNAGIYLWTGDEQGNVCAGPWRSGGTSWWGDFGHTTFRAGLMGPPWNLVCPNSYRIPGDVCQLRHMSNINAAALGGWSDPYTQAFKDGGYLETYDAAAHAGYLESDYGAWETSAYWSFNEDRTVDPAHHSGLDFRSAASTAPSDGEMRNADNGYDDGPSLS
ncbi:MAG: hypothetical protein DRJ50_00765 [Actinobacteria bacterium]|nr:MAG: hypothetical protein DRJ50_00765 [Actinomycetota bacterium]